MSDEQEALREALKRTAVALKQGGVPFALAGGYAGWALGGPEPEHDVDLVVAEDDARQAEQVLTDAQLRVEQPPEDWLFKVFDGPAMVDVLFRVAGEPVSRELLDRAQEREVLSVRMPVLGATDLLVSKLLALSEHSCDLGKVLPAARALREQVDWQQVRDRTAHNPFAAVCLDLLERLQVAPAQPPARSSRGHGRASCTLAAVQPLYTAEATAYDARLGAVRSSDERLDLSLSRPAAMGGDDGPGTNPEQLFAAGYAACFHSAMRLGVAALGLGSEVLEGSHVTARVTLLREPPASYGLAVELDGHLPGVPAEQRQALMERTHGVCPYSVATRGNVEVALRVSG